MSAQDQLEIINAQGDIRFHPLTSGGITNIGRHPDNDIVIDSPDVAPFHAVLDHQHKPYRLIALAEGRIKVSGQLLQPNSPRELRNWDSIELNGHSFVLLEGGAAGTMPAPTLAAAPLPTPIPPIPAEAAPAPGGDIPAGLSELEAIEELLASIPEDRVDDLIIVEPMAQNGAIDASHPNALDFSVDVEQSATMQITIVNGGDFVGEFRVEVRGVDPSWVAVAPAAINLNEGERGAVAVAITAPRRASSRAKAYYFAVVVTSPNYPGRMSSTTGLFVIKPFHDFSVGDIDPKKQNISYSKKVGQSAIPIINLGNSAANFQLSGEDERHAANIEFDSPEEGLKLAGQIEVTVPPESTLPVSVFITPRKRRLVGWGGEDIHYTLTVTPLSAPQQTPRTVLGQASSRPLIGPLPIILLGVLLVLLGVILFRPWIGEFKADAAAIRAGDEVTLNWRASPFVSLKIEPGVGKVDGSQGSLTLQPEGDTTYTLKAENLLTNLSPQWFGASAEATVKVEPVLPTVKFSADRETIFTGERVTLSWEIEEADEVLLTVNGAPETILPGEHIGSREYALDKDTTFVIKASNPYSPEGVTASVEVKVTVPAPTPPPLPVIQRFDVTPSQIVAGESVTISWSVAGATSVTIEGIGEVPASGSITAKPQANTGYVLKAANGPAEVSSKIQQVIVSPAPTPTPLPQTPQIEFFTAAPAEVALGSPQQRSIQLSWSVTGNTTNIEVSGPDFGRASGLEPRGTLTVGANRSTLFILTAFNGTLSASQTVQVRVAAPVPVINGLSPSSAIAQSPDFVVTVNGSNFVSGSIVRWEGANRPTTFVSTTQLRATISSTNVASAGTFRVTVFNPAPGGGTSGVVNFSVTNPSPSISSIAPSSATVNDLAFTLIVNGSGFTPTSRVRWNSTDLTTSFVSSSQLTASVSTSEVSTAGTAAVTVFNPTPGGGTSGSATFTINALNDVPVVTSVAPNTANVGSADTLITVTGDRFTSRSEVRWNGLPLNNPVFVNNQTIQATIPSTRLTSPGTFNITVFNPAPGGGTSPTPATFTVTYPGPTITSFDPNPPVVAGTVTAGSAGFQLEINGTNFVSGATVTWNGTSRTATFVSSALIRAQITTADLSIAGTPTIRVTNPDTQFVTQTLTVANPSITLSPGAVSMAPSGTATMTVTISAAQAASRQITLVSSNTAVATVPGSVFTGGAGNTTATFTVTGGAVGGSSTITATLVGFGNDTDTATATVTNPGPTITALLPASNIAGSGAFTLTVSGTNFINGATVNWGGSARATTFVSASQLTASILAADVASAGTVNVTVTNPTPCAPCTSTASTFTIDNPVPTISSLSPSSATAGGAAFTLTINGTNFVTGAVVTWSGQTNLTPATLTTTVITVNVPASYVASAGTPNVAVVNPTPGGGASGPSLFTVNNPTPTINAVGGLSPSTATAGGLGFTLTLNGTNFVNGALAQWNGTSVSTTFVSATQLTATIATTDIAAGGSINVTVQNPAPCSPCTSVARTFTVSNPTITLSAPSPATIQVGGGADSASESAFTVTISGGAQAAAQTINLTDSSASLGLTNCATTAAITSVVTTGPNFNTATFCAVGLSAGSGTVTATLSGLGGDSDTSSTITVNNPTITFTAGPTPATIDIDGSSASTTASLTVTISAAQTTGTLLTLTRSSTAINLPANPTITAGSTSVTFSVTAAVAGSATVTATPPWGAAGAITSGTITVVP